MTGLKPENKTPMINALKSYYANGGDYSLKVIDDALPDAEKWDADSFWWDGAYDSNQCWAASASNMLWISGWAQRFTNPATGRPFSSEDDVFGYYNIKFSNNGADVDRGIDWFFMGEFFMNGSGTHCHLLDEVDPEDGLMKEFVSSFAQKKIGLIENPADIAALERLDRNSEDPAVFQASVGEIDDNTLSNSEHSVTAAGVVINPNASSPGERYQAIAIINSDNDATPSAEASQLEDPTFEQKQADKAARPNSVTFYPLRYRTASDGRKYWEIVGYSEYGTEVLYSVNALTLPENTPVADDTETEGSCSVVNTVDLTIDTATVTDSDEAITDIYVYERKGPYRTTFAVGEKINLNYFVSNRRSVILDEAYATGEDLEIVWRVGRASDGAIVAEGTDTFALPIGSQKEKGQLIRLNENSGEIESWNPGEYTVTLCLNLRHTIKEAYYLNNTAFTCSFRIIDKLRGDADIDGTVTILDATAIQRYLVDLSCPEGIGESMSAKAPDEEFPYLKNKPSCPECGSESVAYIIYGEPLPEEYYSDAFRQKLDNGEITFGGCIVSPDSPKWYCNSCRHSFNP